MDYYPLLLSLKVAFLATLFTFVFGLLAAQLTVKLRHGKGILDGLFTLPLVLPPTVVGFFLLVIFGINSFIGQFLDRIGASVIFSWTGAVIASTVVSFPLMYRTARGAFEQMDENLLNAGRTLGMSESGALFSRYPAEFHSERDGRNDSCLCPRPRRVRRNHYACRQYSAQNTDGFHRNLFRGSGRRLGHRLPLDGHHYLYFLRYHPADELVDKTCRRNEEKGGQVMALSVDIEKDLGDFHLKSKFTAGDETLAILGASGCGKSMTLKCIAGVETPDSGRIVLDGKVLFDSGKKINLPARLRKTGYLFQNYALFPNMTVEQNIACGIHRKKEETRKIVKEKISAFYLDGLEKQYPSQLSGGQQQRVALARMLAGEPQLIMLDEPLSALDSFLKWKLEQEILRVKESFHGSILFVSHSRDEVYRLCDRIVAMEDGKTQEAG